MNYDTYELTQGSTVMEFTFESIGPKGKFKKLIQFNETQVENIYNLAFGDYDQQTHDIDAVSYTHLTLPTMRTV